MKKLWGLIACMLLILTLRNQQTVADAVFNSMKRCVYSIIPTLFANSVICSVIVKSGIIRAVMSKIYINGIMAELLILGNLGGYPIGAKLIKDSIDRNEISKAEGEKLICCCFSPGPAFCIGVIGRLVYGNQKSGALIYLVSLAVNLLIFVFLCRNLCKVKKHYSAIEISTADIVDSVNSSAISMISITAIIAIFSGITALFIDYLGYVKLYCFTQLLDITNIISTEYIKFPTACMLVSFGGICIFVQIVSIIEGKLSLKRFALTHFIRFPFNYLLGLFAEKIIDSFGISVATIRYSESNSIIPIICVFAMIYICAKRNPDQR